MKEYIRATHNFNNVTREWDNIEHKKLDYWHNLNEKIKALGQPLWSFGVHALERDSWRYMRSIIDNTIGMYKGGGADESIRREFLNFIESTPNYREIIKRDILREFEILIASGDVMVRDNNQKYMEYWDT